MAHASKSHHRKKKWAHQFKGSPFPVPIASLTESPAAPNTWFYFSGELKNDHVVVSKSGDIAYLYKMGFFGRGMLSRGRPSYFKSLPTVHLPGGRGDPESISVMERRMYLRHCRWQKSHDQSSTNENLSPEDQEFDSDVEYSDNMGHPCDMQPYGEGESLPGSCDQKEGFDWSHEKDMASFQNAAGGRQSRGIPLGDSQDMKNGAIWKDNDGDEGFWTASQENYSGENNEENVDNQLLGLKNVKENDWENMEADADFWGVENDDDDEKGRSVKKAENRDSSGSGLKRCVETQNSDDQSRKRVKVSDHELDCDECVPVCDNGECTETNLKPEGEISSQSVKIEGRSVSLTFDSKSGLNTVGDCTENGFNNDAGANLNETVIGSRENLCEIDSNSKIEIAHGEKVTEHSCELHIKENQDHCESSFKFSKSENSESEKCTTEKQEKEIIPDKDRIEGTNQGLEGKTEGGISDNDDRNYNDDNMNDDDGGDVNDIDADDGELEGDEEGTEAEVHPYCQVEEEGGEYLVVDDADIDDRMENVSYKSTYAWRPVRKKDPFVYTEQLLLTPEEAFFLSYGLGCLSVIDENKTTLTLPDLWKVFCRKPRFLAQYAGYHFFRSKGWVPKPGLVFGTDYIVYREGPPFYHGSYSVVVKAVKEGSYEEIEEFSNRKLTWASFAGLNRVTEHVAKTLMFCYVIIPQSLTEEDRQTPACLTKLKVRLQTVDRWVSSQEREKEKESEPEVS